jgi:hypothetical protein
VAGPHTSTVFAIANRLDAIKRRKNICRVQGCGEEPFKYLGGVEKVTRVFGPATNLSPWSSLTSAWVF